MSRHIKKSDSSTLAARRKAGRESALLKAQAREDARLRARLKFEQWIQPLLGLDSCQFESLIAPPDACDEGLFRAKEFSLVPTRDLENYRLSFEDARETLDAMEEQFDAALAARKAEEE